MGGPDTTYLDLARLNVFLIFIDRLASIYLKKYSIFVSLYLFHNIIPPDRVIMLQNWNQNNWQKFVVWINLILNYTNLLNRWCSREYWIFQCQFSLLYRTLLIIVIIFYSRFKLLRDKDPNFEQRWKHLGELSLQAEFNWDEEIEPEPLSKNAVNTRW